MTDLKKADQESGKSKDKNRLIKDNKPNPLFAQNRLVTELVKI